jgi:hypothetical protein
VQLLVDLRHPDVDILVYEDQPELQKVIEKLKNPATPSKAQSILFMALPMTEERFSAEANGEGGRTFIKTLVSLGYTWEVYYDRVVRVLSDLIDTVRALGVAVQMDATSGDVKAALRVTEFDYITIVTNNVGNALEMADGLWPFEDIMRGVSSLPEERRKRLVINIIANDGFELARPLAEAGTNLVLFNTCQASEQDTIQLCIGPFLIPSLYIYSKALPRLDGSTPLDLLYNQGIKEFIQEVLNRRLPSDISLDLRAIGVFKCKLDTEEYAFD